MTWGYVPHFVTDDHPKVHPINARAESAFDKPYFKESIQKRRCLIPTTGYYEWQAQNDHKQPFHIHLPRQHPFLMAGIWDYRGGDESQPTVAILTTQAPMDLAAIHDRMPVIIPNELIYNWFEHPDNRLLMPVSSGVFEAAPSALASIMLATKDLTFSSNTCPAKPEQPCRSKALGFGRCAT